MSSNFLHFYVVFHPSFILSNTVVQNIHSTYGVFDPGVTTCLNNAVTLAIFLTERRVIIDSKFRLKFFNQI